MDEKNTTHRSSKRGDSSCPRHGKQCTHEVLVLIQRPSFPLDPRMTRRHPASSVEELCHNARGGEDCSERAAAGAIGARGAARTRHRHGGTA
jgi:hypothetical protein